MAHSAIPNIEPEYQPSIPNAVRTGVYVLGLVTGFCIIIVNGAAPILWPNYALETVAVSGVVGTAVGWLSSALGVAYRPTAQVPASRPVKGS